MRDLSDLPKKNGRGGLLPDAEPRFVQALVEKWAAEHDDGKPTALGTPFRHSDAGKCGRAISYTAAGIPTSDPFDLPGIWNVRIGTMIHDLWQEEIEPYIRANAGRIFPEGEIVAVDLEPPVATVGVDGSGHIDAVIRVRYGDGRTWVVAYELKSQGGWGFKNAIGAARKGDGAEGPKTDHLLQGCLNGLAVDADEVVIGYLAKECISVNEAKRWGMTADLDRFAAEWAFSREEYEPLALKEAERVAGLLALVEDDTLGRRTVPYEMEPAAEIVDVERSGWTVERNGETMSTGTVWNGSYCAYCKYASLCALTGPGRIPVAEAREAAVTLGLLPTQRPIEVHVDLNGDVVGRGVATQDDAA